MNSYTDEDFMKDGNVVDVIMKGASQVMVNKLTADFYAALESKDSGTNPLIGTTTFAKGGSIGYGAIVDAIADMNVEDESQLFLLVSPSWKAAIRKDEDYKSAQMGEVIYNGQVGTIAGIPVIVSKALTGKNVAYLLTKEAVTCFMKKDVEVEQHRKGENRINELFFRTAYVVAVTDATVTPKPHRRRHRLLRKLSGLLLCSSGAMSTVAPQIINKPYWKLQRKDRCSPKPVRLIVTIFFERKLLLASLSKALRPSYKLRLLFVFWQGTLLTIWEGTLGSLSPSTKSFVCATKHRRFFKNQKEKGQAVSNR